MGETKTYKVTVEESSTTSTEKSEKPDKKGIKEVSVKLSGENVPGEQLFPVLG